MKNQHTFPQRVGKLIEDYIIDTEELHRNKRQQQFGYYDAYNKDTIFEIKAAKNDNYFRIMQKNHERLQANKGTYILIRYSLINIDKDLKALSDIKIENKRFVEAVSLKGVSTSWLKDQRKNNLYYKVKL